MKLKSFQAETSKKLCSCFFPRGDRTGFSLIEMVVVLVIVSIGFMGLSVAVGQILGDNRSFHAALSKTIMSASIRKALTQRRSLKNTILNNPVMKVAVTANPADYAAIGGTLYTDLRGYGIEIYDTDNQVLAGRGADASGAAAPVYFTTEGSRCSNPGVGKCLIACTATLHLQGKAQGGTPDDMIPYAAYNMSIWDPTLKPDFFMITYTIEVIPTGSAAGIQKKPITGTVFIPIEDVEGLVP